MTRTRIAVIGLLVSTATSIAAGQGKSRLEFGTDASLMHYGYSAKTVAGTSLDGNVFSFPLGNVRVAFPLNGVVAIEPAGSFAYSSVGGRTTLSGGFELGLPVNLGRDQSKAQWYIRPAIGLLHASSSTFSTVDRATLGGGLGVRLPWTGVISSRFEARYQHLSRANGFSENAVGVLAGISVFTR